MGDIPSWIGAKLGDRDGLRVGVVCDVYFDEASSRPAWLLVNTLRIGERYAIVPAEGARAFRGGVLVPHERDVIRSSPQTATPFASLPGELVCRLARHYGVQLERIASYEAVHAGALAA